MDPLTIAFTNLVDEYDRLDGVVSRSAQSRRTFVLEAVTAAIFNDLNAWLDPYALDDLDDDAAEECLQFCLHVSDLLAAVMLDFRAKAALCGIHPEPLRGRLLRMLEDIWAMSKTELLETAE